MIKTRRLSRALITFKTLSKTWNDWTTHHQLFQKQIKIAIFLEFNFFQLDIGVVQVEFTHSNKTNIVRIMEAAGARSSRLRIIKEQREEYLEYIFRRIWQPLRLERRFSFCQEGEKSHLKVCFSFLSLENLHGGGKSFKNYSRPSKCRWIMVNLSFWPTLWFSRNIAQKSAKCHKVVYDHEY